MAEIIKLSAASARPAKLGMAVECSRLVWRKRPQGNRPWCCGVHDREARMGQVVEEGVVSVAPEKAAVVRIDGTWLSEL